jgi:hypothetical protein
MSQEHRPLKSRSKGCARKSGLLNRTPYANHESPQFTQAFLDGIAATSALIFAVAGVTLLFMPGPCRWVAATSTLIFVVAGAQCFVAAGLSPGRPLKTPPRSPQTRPPWLGRPLTVRVPITVAFAWCGTPKTVGNNAPGTAACRSPLPCVRRACSGTTKTVRAAIPRGAYAPRSWFRVRAPLQMWASRRRERWFFPTAGLRPPLLVARALILQNCDTRERVASRTTGGLRPPLLCCDANVCRRKNDFCDAQTHVHRSGGRQPAVARIAPRGQCTAKYVPRITTVESRAAGVSPPWRVMRTLCGENPALFGDVRTGEQERRASARRGSRNERCAVRIEH